MSQAVAKVMKKQGGGKIINIASIDGVNPEPFVSVYSISKSWCAPDLAGVFHGAGQLQYPGQHDFTRSYQH